MLKGKCTCATFQKVGFWHLEKVLRAKFSVNFPWQLFDFYRKNFFSVGNSTFFSKSWFLAIGKSTSGQIFSQFPLAIVQLLQKKLFCRLQFNFFFKKLVFGIWKKYFWPKFHSISLGN
ncbi:hypothetical protein DF185_11215 [Marinifilum breve]|uniref:Uncharacterized protein n=1 Tax=Marinifilum breve TaxID=2184082 RepID=A0A2V4A054_9BACT|nr:hypothetical protein DF185_11215 [Marinifilum breve]